MNKLLCIAIAMVLLSITMVIPTSSTDVVEVAEPISATETTTIVATTTEPPRNIMTVTATAYCPCVKCCGKWSDGITASGVKAKANRTVAVDRKVIPLGTHIIYNGKEYVAEDTGGAIKGNKIDIYFDSHGEALEFGRQTIEIEVLS